MTDIYIKNASKEEFFAGLVALFYKHAPVEATAFELEMHKRRQARYNDLAISNIGQNMGAIPSWIMDAAVMTTDDPLFWNDIDNVKTFYKVYGHAVLPGMRKKSRSIIVDEIPGGANAQS